MKTNRQYTPEEKHALAEACSDLSVKLMEFLQDHCQEYKSSTIVSALHLSMVMCAAQFRANTPEAVSKEFLERGLAIKVCNETIGPIINSLNKAYREIETSGN